MPSDSRVFGFSNRWYADTSLQQELRSLLCDDDFLDAVSGPLMGDAVSQARAQVVTDRVRRCAGESPDSMARALIEHLKTF